MHGVCSLRFGFFYALKSTLLTSDLRIILAWQFSTMFGSFYKPTQENAVADFRKSARLLSH